jgi:hypothetical protein
MGKERPELGETSDPEAVQVQRDRVKLAQVQHDADLLWLMSSAHGRRVAATLLRWCNVGHVRFHVNDRQEAFWLGEQNIGHRLKADLKRVCHDKLRLMEDEEKNLERNND